MCTFELSVIKLESFFDRCSDSLKENWKESTIISHNLRTSNETHQIIEKVQLILWYIAWMCDIFAGIRWSWNRSGWSVQGVPGGDNKTSVWPVTESLQGTEHINTCTYFYILLLHMHMQKSRLFPIYLWQNNLRNIIKFYFIMFLFSCFELLFYRKL